MASTYYAEPYMFAHECSVVGQVIDARHHNGLWENCTVIRTSKRTYPEFSDVLLTHSPCSRCQSTHAAVCTLQH